MERKVARIGEGQSCKMSLSFTFIRFGFTASRPSFMKTFSFVAASSNSGKTTLIEKIVKLLKARGLRVAVIKHASKGSIWTSRARIPGGSRQAGADTVVLVGAGQMAIMQPIGP